jgi:hypothetical protein
VATGVSHRRIPRALAVGVRQWIGKEHADGWIFKTKAELEQETGLSRHEQGTCPAELKKKRALETSYDRLEHKLFYRINFDRLDELMAADSLAKAEKRLSGKPENGTGAGVRKRSLGGIKVRVFRVHSRKKSGGLWQVCLPSTRRPARFVFRGVSQRLAEILPVQRPPTLAVGRRVMRLTRILVFPFFSLSIVD